MSRLGSDLRRRKYKRTSRDYGGRDLAKSKPEANTEPAQVQTNWHTLSVPQSLERLQTTPGGLTARQASERLLEYGANELPAAERVSAWALLLEQFKNVLVIILLIATALSAVLGHGVEAIAITVIVLFAVLLGFVQEYRAEKAIEALRKMAAPTSTPTSSPLDSRPPSARSWWPSSRPPPTIVCGSSARRSTIRS